jgi:hypothetical protein
MSNTVPKKIYTVFPWKCKAGRIASQIQALHIRLYGDPTVEFRRIIDEDGLIGALPVPEDEKTTERAERPRPRTNERSLGGFKKRKPFFKALTSSGGQKKGFRSIAENSGCIPSDATTCGARDASVPTEEARSEPQGSLLDLKGGHFSLKALSERGS